MIAKMYPVQLEEHTRAGLRKAVIIAGHTRAPGLVVDIHTTDVTLFGLWLVVVAYLLIRASARQ